MDLSTSYMGLQLANPVIVGSSPFTASADRVLACARAGAGAVVLKSLFEEQIGMESAELTDTVAGQFHMHSEAFEYLEARIGMRYGTRAYLDLIEACKAQTEIPIIASINCISTQWWQDFAADTVAAGADALELNIAVMPQNVLTSPAEIEAAYIDIVRAAREAVQVPLAVKIGAYFTNVGNLLMQLRRAGADAAVLFNRFYRPTIDVDRLRVVAGDPWSEHDEHCNVLRWISLVARRIAMDFAATSGIHSGEDLIRMLLAGASTVQVVTTLHEHGVPYIGTMLEDVSAWMSEHGFASLDEFRGLLCQARNPDEPLFGRVQYIKGIAGGS